MRQSDLSIRHHIVRKKFVLEVKVSLSGQDISVLMVRASSTTGRKFDYLVHVFLFFFSFDYSSLISMSILKVKLVKTQRNVCVKFVIRDLFVLGFKKYNFRA